jgi:hypothetical protein
MWQRSTVFAFVPSARRPFLSPCRGVIRMRQRRGTSISLSHNLLIRPLAWICLGKQSCESLL